MSTDDFDFEMSRDDATPFLVYMIAGSLAGLMEHVAIYPIDTVKTHMQTSNNSFLSTISSIYSKGGFSRFWKGSMLIGSASVPAHALYFSVYEYAKVKLGVEDSGFQFGAAALTGATATLFHDMIITPADMIKQRIQLSGSNRCLECAKNVLKNEGLISFYRSLPITLIMNAPYAVTTVTVNENVKKIVKPKERKYKFLSYFLCAGIAGTVASVVTCPMDNIKTRIQTQVSPTGCEKIDSILKESSKALPKGDGLHAKEIEKSPVVYKNIIHTMKKIYYEEGLIKGFFKGATPRILSNSPSVAISWVTYEIVKHALI